jgi:hypothetical protein
MKTLLLIAVSLLMLPLSGCNTFNQRAEEKAATFDSLDPQAREKLKHGVIEIGNTPDMVYIALGRPDEKRAKATDHGQEQTWIYNSYQQDYAGTVHTGYHRVLIYDRRSRRYFVYFEPVYANVYSEHAEENIRIVFRDDKVVSIEQPKG